MIKKCKLLASEVVEQDMGARELNIYCAHSLYGDQTLSC